MTKKMKKIYKNLLLETKKCLNVVGLLWGHSLPSDARNWQLHKDAVYLKFGLLVSVWLFCSNSNHAESPNGNQNSLVI